MKKSFSIIVFSQAKIVSELRRTFHKPTKPINHNKIYKRNKKVRSDEF